MSKYSLSAKKTNNWYGGYNRGIINDTASYGKQLAYDSYTDSYYTTYLYFESAADISNTNVNYYPTSIQLVASRASNVGVYSVALTGRLGCITADKVDGVSGLTSYTDVTILGTGSGSQTYTITTNLAKAQTFVNALIGGGCISLGCNKQPTSSSYPMSMSNYLALNYSGMELIINWATRATACTPPTSVVITPDVGTPNQSISIKWSGASGGTNNAISGYRIFWKENGVPTFSNYTGYIDVAAVSSTTVNVSSTRETTRYFTIQTKGAYGGDYWSGMSSAYDSILTNVLPTISDVAPNNQTVPSSQTTINFTSFTATANAGFPTLSYYYSTTSTGTKISCTTSTALSLTTGNNSFYIWAYDGAEFSSSYITRTYTRNTAPSISNFVITCPSLLSQKTIDAGYVYATTISSSTLTYNKGSGGTFTYEYKISTTWHPLTVNSTGTLSNIALTNLSGVSAGTKIESIRVKVSDGVEETAWVESSIKVHIVADSTFVNAYNQWSNSNISNTNTSHFFQKMRIYFTGDTGITKITYSINSGSEVILDSSSYNKGNSSTNGYINLDLSNVATSKGLLYSIVIKLYRDTIATTFATLSKTRTNLPTFSNISALGHTLGTTGLKPHTSTSGTFNITLANIFSNATPSYVNDFDMSTTLSDNLTVKFGYSGTYISASYASSSLSSDTITLTYNKAFFTTAIVNGLGITNLYGSYPISIQLTIKNSFNEEENKIFSSVFNLNFTEIYPTPTITMKLDNTSWASNGVFVRKNNIINLTVAFQTYNYVPTTIQAQIARMNSVTTPGANDWVNFGNITTLSPSGPQAVGGTWSGSPVISTTVTDNITESKYVYFRIRITNALDTTSDFTCPYYGISVQHSPAAGLSINSLKFIKGSPNNLTIDYNSLNSGLYVINGDTSPLSSVAYNASLEFSSNINFTTISYTLAWQSATSYATIQTNFTNKTNGSSTITASSLPSDGWTFLYARIKLTTTDSLETPSGASQIRTTYSPVFVVYNAAPTVAYRSNQIAINYDLNASTEYTDAVLVVSETSDKNRIYFLSAGGAESGSYIELDNGEIILGGGTWD